MRRYRSMRRAVRRGHYIDIRTGTYMSKKEQKVLSEKWRALMKKEDKDGSGED